MNERRRNWITWVFVAATIAIVALMMLGSLQKPEPIQLPVTDSVGDENSSDTEYDALTVIDVTPETVQLAIASLARPADYSRDITVEQIWSKGSTATETSVSVRDGWTRTDRSLPGGQIRHTITDGETTYIWYNTEDTVYVTAAGEISADMEQGIPTYEDVLLLPVDSIITADYRTISKVNCIYVETEPDESGYEERYWVSVETGLLVAAEKLVDGEPIYRMASLAIDKTVPGAERFTLPDGNALIQE